MMYDVPVCQESRILRQVNHCFVFALLCPCFRSARMDALDVQWDKICNRIQVGELDAIRETLRLHLFPDSLLRRLLH